MTVLPLLMPTAVPDASTWPLFSMVTVTPVAPGAAITGVMLLPVQSTAWPLVGVTVGAQAALAMEATRLIAMRAVEPSRIVFMMFPDRCVPQESMFLGVTAVRDKATTPRHLGLRDQPSCRLRT
jgi:hypothetical protein